MQVFFKDGTSTEKVEVEYPLGHRRRRAEGMPLLVKKARENLAVKFAPQEVDNIVVLFDDRSRLEATPVTKLLDQWGKDVSPSVPGSAWDPGREALPRV